MLVVTLFIKVMLKRRFGAFVPYLIVRLTRCETCYIPYELLCSVLTAFSGCECRRPSRTPFVTPTFRGTKCWFHRSGADRWLLHLLLHSADRNRSKLSLTDLSTCGREDDCRADVFVILSVKSRRRGFGWLPFWAPLSKSDWPQRRRSRLDHTQIRVIIQWTDMANVQNDNNKGRWVSLPNCFASCLSFYIFPVSLVDELYNIRFHDIYSIRKH